MASVTRSQKGNFAEKQFVDVDDIDDYDSLFDSDSDSIGSLSSKSEDAACVYENDVDMEEEWSSDVKPIRQFSFSSDPKGKVIVDITIANTPREVFDEIFTDNIMEMIVTATNEYGRDLYAKPVPVTRKSPKTIFRDTDTNEMYKFLGLSLLMAQCKFPTIRNAFSKHPLYFHPVFPVTLSGRRYQMLLRSFNCHTPPREDEKQDKLVKVNRLVDALLISFRAAYIPSINLSLDESLLLFRGRLSIRQYIKTKAAKYGVKFYELTTSDGYVLNIFIYQGDQGNDNSVESGGKTEKLVKTLMAPYLDKGHKLFMDNFYNSVSLSKYLLSKNTHVTGTLRANRKQNPKEVIQAKLKKGDMIWRRNGEVYVTKWRDKRDVLSITTYHTITHHPQLIQASNRFGELKLKPNDVADYNNNMGGIDRLDQMTAYFSSPRKTIRWYKKVLFHLLDMAVWNSYFLNKKFHLKSTFLQFRESLIMSMIQCSSHDGRQLVDMISSSGRPISNISGTVSEKEESAESHRLEKIPAPSTFKPNYYKRCKNCSKNKIRKDTCHNAVAVLGSLPFVPNASTLTTHKNN
ncbi:PiggyBac transposable element-derived protein 4 [Pseudolycoriella hygida]|uniref:PiggyBac transposable element-derived protein 4 n=1 Tax=Pseudolycoriella hygida TaxID=35572 RepID=A0A9Q0S1W2_9DIPT|nr:PiggyBac transposable element-derived protein 4 [Pseudolycoriella hygida]